MPCCVAAAWSLASYQIYFFCAGETGSYARLGLPVDPLLGTAYASSIQLPLPLGTHPEIVARTAAPSVVIVEGIPPIPVKLVEKIRRWEFIDLAKLLVNQEAQPDQPTVIIGGQVVGLDSPARSQRRATAINDITSWVQAFSRFMAVLLSAGATTKEEAAGLAAHQHLILQLAKDLGGKQWAKYDWEFREWAAAKNIRVWGDLNMAIYGRCLPQLRPAVGPAERDWSSSGNGHAPACLKWNRGQCNRPLCSHTHACSECGGPHKRTECPRKNQKI